LTGKIDTKSKPILLKVILYYISGTVKFVWLNDFQIYTTQCALIVPAFEEQWSGEEAKGAVFKKRKYCWGNGAYDVTS